MSLIVLLSTFAVLLAAEAFRTLTPLHHGLARRWASNTILFACCQAMFIWLVPAYAATGAYIAAVRNWGLFNHIAAPVWLEALVVLLVVDCVGYFTHRIEHVSPTLWRMHRTHHSDPDLDLTTGLRFHPLEPLVRGSIAALAMILLGAPVAVVAGCVALTGTVSLASHVNADILPAWLESSLQKLLVTPRMHRIHHSMDPRECNSNFGVGLSIWDRLLGTYRGRPEVPFEQMRFGVAERSPAESVAIGKILLDPVRG